MQYDDITTQYHIENLFVASYYHHIIQLQIWNDETESRADKCGLEIVLSSPPRTK